MTADLIPPSEIALELSRIWDSFEGTNKMRASLFNLIFYTKKKARAEYIHTISKKVIEKFPSRVIFITENTDKEENYLNTRVSVVSSSEGENDIACDSIEIDVAGSYVERIPFVILPHILPDLPIYVIWGEDPNLETPLFIQLQKLATRMIFDSESIEDLAKFSSKLIAIDKEVQIDVADLNWGRMENWRELLASTFYTHERLEMLKKTTRIHILYNAQKSEFICHPSIQAIYLQGWLSTQLEWKFQSAKREGETWTMKYNRPNGSVEVTLYPEHRENLKSGSILSVDLETDSNHHFSFGCNLDLPHHISMRFSTLEKCDIPLQYIFSKEESGKSLVKEICQRGTSKHFLNLLQRLKERKEFSLCES